MSSGARAIGLAAAIVIATSGTALAHQTAVKYVDLRVDGATATIELRFQPSDVTRPLGLPDDALPTVDQALAGGAKVTPYITAWLAIRDGDAACPPGPATIARAAADPRFVAVTWTATCPAPIERLVLDLAQFFAADKVHEVVLHLTSPDAEPYDTTIGVADSPLTLTTGDDRPGSAPAWVWHGIQRVYGDPGLIALVVALVVVVVIARRSGAGWQLAPAAAAARDGAVVIGALAVAQVGALLATASGWVAAPARFVELMTAAAIVYLAVENALAPDTRARPVVVLGFGAVVGLGFADRLADALPPDRVIAPVLELGVGIALGMLAIAGIAGAAAWLVARALGAGRYRARIVPAVSIAVVAVVAIRLVGL